MKPVVITVAKQLHSARYAEDVYLVEVMDDGYLLVAQGSNTLSISPEDWPTLRSLMNNMMKNLEKQERYLDSAQR